MAGFLINGCGASDSYYKIKDLVTAYCPRCKKQMPWELAMLKMKIRVVFIPTFSINTKYAVMCSGCRQGYYVSEEQKDFILNNPPSCVEVQQDGVVIHGMGQGAAQPEPQEVSPDLQNQAAQPQNQPMQPQIQVAQPQMQSQAVQPVQPQMQPVQPQAVQPVQPQMQPVQPQAVQPMQPQAMRLQNQPLQPQPEMPKPQPQTMQWGPQASQPQASEPKPAPAFAPFGQPAVQAAASGFAGSAPVCPGCGCQARPGERFCGHCGASLQGQAPQTQIPQGQMPQTQTSQGQVAHQAQASQGIRHGDNGAQMISMLGRRKICPKCQMIFTADKENCNICGSRLVDKH